MNRRMVFFALLALLLPVAARLVWFYPGWPAGREKLSTPDYESMIVPVLPVAPPQADEKVTEGSGVVVLDLGHGNRFQPREIDALDEAIQVRGGQVETAMDPMVLSNQLKYARSYVLISPTVSLTAEEQRLLRAFTARGGRLVVFTDATRGQVFFDYLTGSESVSPDVNVVNPLLADFSIQVNDDYLYDLVQNEGNFRNVFFEDFGKDELTFGLDQVVFYGTHSVETDTGVVLLRGSDHTYSSITDTHQPSEGGAALSADGNVLVFGDFTFMTSPYSTAADNAELIGSIADFLLGGEQAASLAAYPYIYSQPVVHVFPTSSVQMSAELVAALGRLQTAMQGFDVGIQVVSEQPEEGDMLVLGTFEATDDMLPFIEPYDLVLDDLSEFVTLPGFGEIGKSGNGVLIFDPGSRGNTLILLANSLEDLTALLDSLSSSNLANCLVQEDIGICGIGFGGSFTEDGFDLFGELPLEGTPGEFPTFEPLPTEPTPTPIAPDG